MKKTINKAMMLFALLWVVFSNAQSKQKITEADYDKWGDLKWERISDDGKWIAFTMDYTTAHDTLFLQQLKSGKREAFPNATDYSFTPGSGWFLYKNNGALVVRSLPSALTDTIPEVKKQFFHKGTNTLAVLAGANLHLYQHHGRQTTISKVRDFAFSENGRLALVTSTGIDIRKTVSSTPKQILQDSVSVFSGLIWDESGTRLTFFSTDAAGKTGAAMYDTALGYLQQFTAANAASANIALQPKRPLFFDDRAERIFLYVKPTVVPSTPNGNKVEVWEASEPLGYAELQERNALQYAPRLALWDLPENRLKELVNDSLPAVRLLPVRKHMLAFNSYKLRDTALPLPLADYYGIDLATGEQTIVATRLSTGGGVLRPSPNGLLVGYHNQNGWFIYNTQTNKTIKALGKNELSKAREDDDKYGSNAVGFTTDSRFLVAVVGNDVWLLDPNGKANKCMTNAKTSGARFRIVSAIHNLSTSKINEEIVPGYFDTAKGIFFHALMPDKTTAIFRYRDRDGLVQLYKGAGRVSITAASEGYDLLLLNEQTATVPNYILKLDTKTKSAAKLYQSNPHFNQYETPLVKLLSYQNKAGKALNAVLHYPADYDPGKSYPMVVYLYEILSHNLHNYNAPTKYSQIGFTPANYTNEGYFVLYPDTVYTQGDPGPSMADCVLSAVDASLTAANIDKNRLGIIGHSYGGHEVALLITKTPLFKAAVVGAGVSDMVSDYLRLYEGSGFDKMWRYEAHQYRMQSSLFSNRDSYLSNSPVLQATNISTPVLNWAGKQDDSVDYRQSVEMHLALKRLQKVNTLFLYPDEGTIINDPEARADLTRRTKEWFNHYLKQ